MQSKAVVSHHCRKGSKPLFSVDREELKGRRPPKLSFLGIEIGGREKQELPKGDAPFPPETRVDKLSCLTLSKGQ